MVDIDVLAKCYLLTGLPEERVREIAAIAEHGRMLAGEDLMRAGERSSDLFVILDGKVNVMTKGGDKLGEAGVGSVLGEVALVDDQPRSATATCAGMVSYAKFPAPALRAYMSSHRDVGFVMLANLSRVLSMRLRQTDAAMEGLFVKTRDSWDHAL